MLLVNVSLISTIDNVECVYCCLSMTMCDCYLCYLWQVSRIQEVVECLLEYQEEVLLADVTVTEILTVIISINTVIQVCHTSYIGVSSNMHLGAKLQFYV